VLEDGGAQASRTLKIALIGTHGVGKTTLAFDLCSKLKKAHQDVELVAEVARSSPFPVNEGTTLEGQLWILHTQIATELDAARRAGNVICDRSVLDNYCYLVNKFGRQAQLESWIDWWMESYQLLVGVPPLEQEIPSDGFRSENLEFQRRIHELLKRSLAQPPFTRLVERVVWLEPGERTEWGERIFSLLLPAVADARQAAHP
jgi:nicotinamide riboside kinase